MFVATTFDGTLSIYSQTDSHSYDATPTEQAFHLDIMRDTTSETYMKEKPKLCDITRHNYETQPPNQILGQFRD